jgi:hypothetical protein
MIDRNKITYKLKFYTNSLIDNKIFNFTTKEFEPICYNPFDFNIIKTRIDHICFSDTLINSDEIGFNTIGEVINNPSHILFKIDYCYETLKIFNQNNIYLLDSKEDQKILDNLDGILTSNITKTLPLTYIFKKYLILTKNNIIKKFLDVYTMYSDLYISDLEEYLDKTKCLEYILDNVIFFVKPFNNFNNNEYYLIIDKKTYTYNEIKGLINNE